MTGRPDRPITIRGAGALAASLLFVLAQVNACSQVKSPADPPRAEAPPPREAEKSPAAPSPVEPAQPKPAEPQPKPPASEPQAPEQPKTAEPPQPKAAEPTQPKAAEPSQPKPAVPAPPPRQERAAIVNLTALEKRLRDTGAIGVFTKLSLKNEVDDLLERFRGFHAGRGGTTLSRLRENYDLLVLKVVSLLQDKDPSLARDISSSREALWALLADPVKFKSL